ncbi:MAG: hypothetical protein WA880_04220 [Ornithinimicrobium sp.]
MEPASIIALVLVALLALGWYLSYTAVRLDRLHTRLEATGSALEAQSLRRSQTAIEVAYTGDLDPASGALLLDAARTCMDFEGTWDAERCAAESALTDLMRLVFPEPPAELEEAAMRLRLARRFHNEAVDQTTLVRRQAAVRAFHLAGHTALPQPVRFDDGWPPPI